MPYYVYIVKCSDGTYYIGSTADIDRRVNEHNFHKKAAHYTKIRRPVVLKYKEEFATLQEARRREYALKQLTRKEKASLCKDLSDR